MWSLLIAAAQAATFTLDTGMTLEGDLERWEELGVCELRIEAGPLDGTRLTLPCDRLGASPAPEEPPEEETLEWASMLRLPEDPADVVEKPLPEEEVAEATPEVQATRGPDDMLI